VGIVGRLDPDNWTEVRRQNRQGVYGSVIQGADLQDRRRIVVPFRETADVRCGIAPPNRAKPALLHEAPGQALSVPRNRVGGTAENHPAIVGRLDQRLCLGSIEGQGLFAVRGHTGLDCGPSDLGVRRVSRQVDEETNVFGPQ
jgi:hypothetical protein